MYRTVSIRIGISWCVQYCVSKVCTVGQYRDSWCVQYCVSKDRDLLVCTVLCQ